MLVKYTYGLVILSLLTWNLTGCSGFTQRSITSTPTSIPVSNYPGPNETLHGYPAPLAQITPTAQIPQPPPDAPIPVSGQASISGVLYSFAILRIVPDTLFYLTPAIGDDKHTAPSVYIGPNEQIGDRVGRSDIQAQFAINDIPPGNYYLVVSAPANWAIAITAIDNLTPRLIELTAGQRLPLGIVYISWP